MSARPQSWAEVDRSLRNLEEDFRRAAAEEQQPEAPMEDDPRLLLAAPEPQAPEPALPPWMAYLENKLDGGQRRLEAVMSVQAQRITTWSRASCARPMWRASA